MNINEINLDAIEAMSKTTFKLDMIQNALGDAWQVPVMIAKGQPGPVLGVTAAIHGNELNGILVIHKLWEQLNVNHLQGTIIFVPVVNTPGFMNGEREFSDGKDLNRIMPGKPGGTTSERYAHAIMNKIVKKVECLLDLHTASFGRTNSFYVRVDMKDPKPAKMALLQDPQIIVHCRGEKGTLREQAGILGIPCITLEIGDPYILQKRHVNSCIRGFNNLLSSLSMQVHELKKSKKGYLVCQSSAWIYAKNAGILKVFPELADIVKKGDIIAEIVDVFGNAIETIESNADAVVVGKSTNPVCQSGSRVVHLGIVGENFE